MEQQEKEYYLNQGYTEAQVEELEAGKDAGLDISVYENPELTAMHMYQLRLGLAEGLNMKPYADGSFDWFQIEEIRKGLSDFHDVSIYAKPSIPSDKMHQLRRGLDDGMDLSGFLNFKAGVIRQIRKALVNKVDVTTYAKQGYDEGQLEEIRFAMMDGLDIHQYLSPDLRAVSIAEIAEGLKEGVDVEVYAKTCYTWTQMREIRLGLLNQIDVRLYLSPLYDRYQMREIRLGLEEGLEVSEYTSLMYPASAMHKIREELLNTGVLKSDGGLSAEEVNESNRDGLYVQISKDDMSALIRFDSSMFGKTTRKDILRTLRLLGITQNINPRMMDDLLTGKHLDELVEIARGTPAVNGADGYYEYFFDVKKDRSPKVNPDGSVDFQTVEWFEQVRKDQKLAYYHSAGKGEAGSTVTGKRIAPKKGRELQGLRGKGIMQLPDKKTYIALWDGMVQLDGFKLDVSQILKVPEVTLATGNIHFEGNVEVEGDVTSGAKIIAGGNVIINGFVEAAQIEATGDVILKKGANGHGIGSISAGGNVEARFFEGISVKAGTRIDANYSLNSKLYSEDCIVIHGSKGMILGGSAFAIREIRVNNVGNSAGVKTLVTLGASEKMHSDLRKLEERLAELDSQMIVLMKGKADFEKKFPPEVRNIMETYIKINNAIYTLKLQRDEASSKKSRLFEQIAKTVDAHMVVTGDLFDGNIIDINGKKLKSVYANNVTVKMVLNRVGIFKN